MIRSKATVIVALAAALLLVAAPVGDAKPGKARGPKGPRPDLVLALTSKAPASATLGSKLSLALKVRNKGKAQAGKSQVGVYLAKGKKHGKKDVRLGRAKVKAMKGGKSATVKLAVTIPANAKPGSYRLIACADDSRHVRESKEGNDCAASGAFAVAANSPVRPAAAAFSMSDGISWGFPQNANGEFPSAGRPVNVTLRAANGVPGQAGYARSNVPPSPFLTEPGTSLTFSDLDDGATAVTLPFAFPFGGILERSVSISTNGWMGFGGSPAPEAFNFPARNDYRGVNAAVGEFERGIMPDWSDLDLEDQGAGTGTVKEVIAADGSSVGFQWNTGRFVKPGTPRRTFQVVLFKDGRFRIDYPGENAAGAEEAFIGYSLGTGPSSVVGSRAEAVPSTSLLFTPNPVASGTPLEPAQETLTLPPESKLVSADPGCALAQAPAPFTPGLVSCATPAIAPGTQLERTITFAMPPKALGQASPADFRYQGTYSSRGLALTDRDEIDALDESLPATTITPVLAYVPPPPPATTPKVGEPAQFSATIKPVVGGLDEPSVTFTLPANTNLDSIQIAGQNVPCGAPSGGQVNCQLPSGLHTTTPPTTITVTVTPVAAAANTELTLGVSARALNAPAATGSAKSPLVAP